MNLLGIGFEEIKILPFGGEKRYAKGIVMHHTGLQDLAGYSDFSKLLTHEKLNINDIINYNGKYYQIHSAGEYNKFVSTFIYYVKECQPKKVKVNGRKIKRKHQS